MSARRPARRAPVARPAVPGRRKAVSDIFTDVRALAEKVANTPIYEDDDASATHALYMLLRGAAKALDVFDMGRIAGLNVSLAMIAEPAVTVQAVEVKAAAPRVINLDDFRRAAGTKGTKR